MAAGVEEANESTVFRELLPHVSDLRLRVDHGFKLLDKYEKLFVEHGKLEQEYSKKLMKLSASITPQEYADEPPLVREALTTILQYLHKEAEARRLYANGLVESAADVLVQTRKRSAKSVKRTLKTVKESVDTVGSTHAAFVKAEKTYAEACAKAVQAQQSLDQGISESLPEEQLRSLAKERQYAVAAADAADTKYKVALKRWNRLMNVRAAFRNYVNMLSFCSGTSGAVAAMFQGVSKLNPSRDLVAFRDSVKQPNPVVYPEPKYQARLSTHAAPDDADAAPEASAARPRPSIFARLSRAPSTHQQLEQMRAQAETNDRAMALPTDEDNTTGGSGIAAAAGVTPRTAAVPTTPREPGLPEPPVDDADDDDLDNDHEVDLDRELSAPPPSQVDFDAVSLRGTVHEIPVELQQDLLEQFHHKAATIRGATSAAGRSRKSRRPVLPDHWTANSSGVNGVGRGSGDVSATGRRAAAAPPRGHGADVLGRVALQDDAREVPVLGDENTAARRAAQTRSVVAGVDPPLTQVFRQASVSPTSTASHTAAAPVSKPPPTAGGTLRSRSGTVRRQRVPGPPIGTMGRSTLRSRAPVRYGTVSRGGFGTLRSTSSSISAGTIRSTGSGVSSHSGSGATTGNVQVFVAQFPWQGDKSDDLTLVEGDVIHVAADDMCSNGWWFGESQRGFGMFPGNYVAAYVPAAPQRVRKPYPVVAMCDFDTVEAEELPMKQGDRLIVVEESQDGWVKVHRQGQGTIEGWVPASYLEGSAS